MEVFGNPGSQAAEGTSHPRLSVILPACSLFSSHSVHIIKYHKICLTALQPYMLSNTF